MKKIILTLLVTLCSSWVLAQEKNITPQDVIKYGFACGHADTSGPGKYMTATGFTELSKPKDISPSDWQGPYIYFMGPETDFSGHYKWYTYEYDCRANGNKIQCADAGIEFTVNSEGYNMSGIAKGRGFFGSASSVSCGITPYDSDSGDHWPM